MKILNLTKFMGRNIAAVILSPLVLTVGIINAVVMLLLAATLWLFDQARLQLERLQRWCQGPTTKLLDWTK